MAIIKCPECTNEVSTAAEKCPHCGVRIVGNIKVCPDCGKVVLKSETACPSCKASLANTPVVGGDNGNVAVDNRHARRHTLPVVLVIIAALIAVGVGAYFYYTDMQNAQKEQEAYNNVIAAKDTALCNQYLAVYPEGAHVTEVKKLLDELLSEIKDWQDACISGTRSDFARFLIAHAGSSFEQVCNDKLDSLDFAAARADHTVEAYQTYLHAHPDGRYSDEAMQLQTDIDAFTVKPEDETRVKNACECFFRAIGEKDKPAFLASVAPVMKNFLNKQNATQDDVAQFFDKITQNSSHSTNFTVNDDYKIHIIQPKSANAAAECDATFTVVKNTYGNGGVITQQETLAVTTHVNGDGKVTSLGMKRLTPKTNP